MYLWCDCGDKPTNAVDVLKVYKTDAHHLEPAANELEAEEVTTVTWSSRQQQDVSAHSQCWCLLHGDSPVELNKGIAV